MIDSRAQISMRLRNWTDFIIQSPRTSAALLGPSHLPATKRMCVACSLAICGTSPICLAEKANTGGDQAARAPAQPTVTNPTISLGRALRFFQFFRLLPFQIVTVSGVNVSRMAKSSDWTRLKVAHKPTKICLPSRMCVSMQAGWGLRLITDWVSPSAFGPCLESVAETVAPRMKSWQAHLSILGQ